MPETADKQILPPFLVTGDTIGVITPAGPIADRSGLLAGIKLIENEGYKVVVPEELAIHDYLAGTDKKRAEHCPLTRTGLPARPADRRTALETARSPSPDRGGRRRYRRAVPAMQKRAKRTVAPQLARCPWPCPCTRPKIDPGWPSNCRPAGADPRCRLYRG